MNEHDAQCYSVGLHEDPAVIERHMNDSINTKWISMEVDNNDNGALFTFSIKTLGEDQYKSPVRKHIRKQSSFRSSFGPSKSFGGIKGYSQRKLRKKLAEALKLEDDLEAHDNVTVIPAGTEIKIHDPDPRLPDVDWDGTTTNVDKDKLKDAIDKASGKEFKETFKEETSNRRATVGNFLTSRIHEGYTVAADRALAAGLLTQEERIALSEAITDALRSFTDTMKSKFPRIYRREMEGDEAMKLSSGSTFRERIDKRMSSI
jgi:hypothetical protein